MSTAMDVQQYSHELLRFVYHGGGQKELRKEGGIDCMLVIVFPIDKRYAFTDWVVIIGTAKVNIFYGRGVIEKRPIRLLKI